MEEGVHKSCWGLTAWAVAGAACVIFMALLLGDVDSTVVMTAN